MEKVIELKQQRSKAKQAVTTAMRRLTRGLSREEDLENLNGMFLELEEAYDEFCVINDEYEVAVTPEEFAEHRVVNGMSVREYESAMKQVYDDASLNFTQFKTAGLQEQKEMKVFPLKSALSRSIIKIKELVVGIRENIESGHPDTLILQEDEGELNRLSNEMWDNLSKLGMVSGSEHSQEGIVHDIQRMVCNLKRDINKCLRMHATKHEVPVPVQPTLIDVTHSPPSASAVHGTSMTGVQQHSMGQESPNTVSSPHFTTTPTHPRVTAVSSPVNLPISSPTSLEFGTSNTGVQQHSMSQENPHLGFSPHFTTTPTHTQVTTVSSPANLPISSPIPSAAPTHASARSWYQPWSPGLNYAGRSTDIQLKKMELPTFSGLRKDWPEFKTVWKQLAENAYTNQAALASELKRSVKGEARERIKSVYVTRPEAYQVMWKKQ